MKHIKKFNENTTEGKRNYKEASKKDNQKKLVELRYQDVFGKDADKARELMEILPKMFKEMGLYEGMDMHHTYYTEDTIEKLKGLIDSMREDEWVTSKWKY